MTSAPEKTVKNKCSGCLSERQCGFAEVTFYFRQRHGQADGAMREMKGQPDLLPPDAQLDSEKATSDCGRLRDLRRRYRAAPLAWLH